MTVLILPSLKMSGNVDILWMIVPGWFWYFCVFLNNEFKRILVEDCWSVDISKAFYEVENNFFLFFTILYNSMSFVLDELFSKQNINDKGSMIWWILQIEENGMIINFDRVWLKKEEINDWIYIIDIVGIKSGDLLDKTR